MAGDGDRAERAERVRKHKDERRKRLAAQTVSGEASPGLPDRKPAASGPEKASAECGHGGGSPGVRTTRTSRLRAASSGTGSGTGTGPVSKERPKPRQSSAGACNNAVSCRRGSRTCVSRDKELTEDAIVSRGCFPSLNFTSKTEREVFDSVARSATSCPRRSSPRTTSVPAATAATAATAAAPVAALQCSRGRPAETRAALRASPAGRRAEERETARREAGLTEDRVSDESSVNIPKADRRRLTGRIEAVEALTKETFARVARLTNATPEPRARDSLPEPESMLGFGRFPGGVEPPSASRRLPELLGDIDAVTQHLLDFEKQNLGSSSDSRLGATARRHNDPPPLLALLSYTPVSILKRKSSQDEHGSSSGSGGAAPTPPVTFSPSVMDPGPSEARRRGQGILKKRRSLDESQVNRRRSCSPEVAFADDRDSDSRPALRIQRRSSLEEVARGRSPDGQIQGILKRKCSRDGEIVVEDGSLGSPEPQGILKRKSDSGSGGSVSSSHVSIAQAVILAAAGGAEIVEDKDGVRPILKKKSFSEERPRSDSGGSDAPRPILKKKSLTESDDNDRDRPKKPILKSARKVSHDDGNASSFDLSEDDRSSRRSSVLRYRTPDGSEGESGYRPILKRLSREHSRSPRPRLSFCSDDERTSRDEDGEDPELLSGALSLRLSDDDTPRPPETPDENYAGATSRRRAGRPRACRSHSLACNFSEELNVVLSSRRSMVDENGTIDATLDPSVAFVSVEPDPAASPPADAFPSIAERIRSMELYLGKGCSGRGRAGGAVPKRHSRHAERFRTQPVTVHELHSASHLEIGQSDFQRRPVRLPASAERSPEERLGSPRRRPSEEVDPPPGFGRNSFGGFSVEREGDFERRPFGNLSASAGSPEYREPRTGSPSPAPERARPAPALPDWNLSVSADSGVFNRMSSGDSGPLSGEESSLAPGMAAEAPEEDAADNPQALQGLMKSNSVCARASMWQQMQQQASKASVKPTVRHSRSKTKDGSPSVLDRFKTQPVTLEEVTSASAAGAGRQSDGPAPLAGSKSSFNLTLEQDEDAKLDENDPAKLTLAEKMKLFGASRLPKPPPGDRKPRSARFQTMPVLPSLVDDAKQIVDDSSKALTPERRLIKLTVSEEKEPSLTVERPKNLAKDVRWIKKCQTEVNIDKKADNNSFPKGEDWKPKKDIGINFRLAQNRLAEQASRMLTSEVRGILKARSGAVPVLPAPQPPSISKGDSSEGLKDEGIDSSSDESVSGSSTTGQSCSSSESSEESEVEADRSPPPAPVKPSQLKSSRTDTDLSQVLKDNTRTDGRIKLPCMDELRARKIMEKCMTISEKENLQKPRVTPLQQKKLDRDDFLGKKSFDKTEDNIDSIKLKNFKNGTSLMKRVEDPGTKAGEESEAIGELIQHLKMNKSSGPVAVGREARLGRAEGEASGSDGESSGGREVRHINTRRRNRGIALPTVSALLPGLRRSATQPMAAPALPRGGGSIAERLAALQQSGTDDWRKRVSRLSPDDDVITATKNRINESLTQQLDDRRRAVQADPAETPGDLLISERRNNLETSAQGWRKRVGQHDAPQFSVAGRMGRDRDSPALSATLAPALAASSPDRRTPQAARFKSRRADGPLKSASSVALSQPPPASSQPASPLRGAPDFRRSVSVSGVDDFAAQEGTPRQNGDAVAGPSVAVPRADDETFTSFFTSASRAVVASSSVSFAPDYDEDFERVSGDIDLDAIDSGPRHMLGGAGVNRVRAARRAGGSRNPLKALAARTDLRQEYTQPPPTGVVDKEAAHLTREKVALANSSMAVEALAGLAAREDFSAVALRKAGKGAGSPLSLSKVTLVHVKGRRRVQARLVRPHYSSINSGDCFVLITADWLFHYAGFYANVIERSRAAEIALHIQTTKDLGCSGSPGVVTLDEQSRTRIGRQWAQFWTLLGVTDDPQDYIPTPAGHADEDEIFESGIVSTNMCYEVADDELIPVQEYWGQIPKIAMLDPSKILVFDFGSELYVWNGKNTILENRRRAFQLAQELWGEGYDYGDCLVCPLCVPALLGAVAERPELCKKASNRPEWAVISKVTQHMENVLFRDKFLDWPDFSRVIKVKEEEDSVSEPSLDIKPCDAERIWTKILSDPGLVLEGSPVGRGTQHYDQETMRNFEVKTKSVTKWSIQEYDYVKIDSADLSEFYSGDSYIVRWEYQMTVTGRELNGKPSKHNITGRDRCAYFCWQGKDASANEKGAAALLTVELDHEKGPQLRVAQGCEPPAFLNLFQGSLIFHQGKRGGEESRYRLYMVRGNISNEAHLVQVSCSMRQLRSRGSMIIADTENGQLYVWHGIKSLKHTRSIALEAAERIALKKHANLFNSNIIEIKISEIKEGDEPKSILEILGGANRQLYHSLLNKDNKIVESAAVTPRLFHFTDLSGKFDAIEVLSPLRHDSLVTPYPFSQQELYSASQPGLFMLDSGESLWLWQGWWPQHEDSNPVEAGAGAGTRRWHACRRAALETCLQYWEVSRGKSEPDTLLVVAGLEPLTFTNLFDTWQDRDDIAELNIMYGYKVGEGACSVSEELCRLTRSSFPLAVLRQRPLPEAVDPAHIQKYLTDTAFQETFGMSKESFYELPLWKQANMKKDLGLF